MADTSKIIRLFISSTFADFAVEREILQRDVFPAVRDICRAEGFRFQPIDLRWGVNQEAGKVGRTLSICFDELRRCQEVSPDLNLLILLGDRYGWRPLPETIPATHYARLAPLLAPSMRALLARVYAQDHNALSGEFVILPRDRERDLWDTEVANPLRAALTQASKFAGFTDEEALSYGGSVTHQEIWRGLLGIQCDPQSVLCIFRDVDWSASTKLASAYVENDREAQGKLAELRRDIEKRMHGPIPQYSAHWSEGALAVDRPKFQKRLYEMLKQRVLKVMKQREQEAQVHYPAQAVNADFEVNRTEGFAERERELAEIAQYCADVSAGKPPIVVTGARGSGKSSLLAQVAKQARTAQPQAVVVSRYIGVSPDSSTLHALLVSVWREIAQGYNLGTPVIPVDDAQIRSDFPEMLHHATAAKPLILLLDGLDQLGAEPQRMEWLPIKLPTAVSAIVSILPQRPELQALRERRPPVRTIALDDLSETAATNLLEEWLRARGRTIQDTQRVVIIAGFAQTATPLYLRVAMNEAAFVTPTRLGFAGRAIACE